MKRGLVVVIAIALLAAGSTASAQVFSKGKVQLSVGLTHFTVVTVDTLFSGFAAVTQAASAQQVAGLFGKNVHDLIGFGADFKYGLSENWALDLAGSYGFGQDKATFTPSGGTADELKLKPSAFAIRGGLDRTVNVNDKFGIFFGPGFEFASSKLKVEEKSGSISLSVDDPSVATFSLDARMGVVAKLSTGVGITGNIGKKFSYSKKSWTDAGGDKVEVASWWSSVNGFAGLAFFF